MKTLRRWIAGKVMNWDMAHVQRQLGRVRGLEDSARTWEAAARTATDRALLAEREALNCRLLLGAIVLKHGGEITVTSDMMEEARQCVIERSVDTGLGRTMVFRLRGPLPGHGGRYPGAGPVDG